MDEVDESNDNDWFTLNIICLNTRSYIFFDKVSLAFSDSSGVCGILIIKLKIRHFYYHARFYNGKKYINVYILIIINRIIM